MSRRSSRRPPKKAASLPAGVTTGLTSLVEGNESLIAKMLSVDLCKEDSIESKRTKLVSSLTDCMTMNGLSAEALLARFFDSSVLKVYCEDRLGVSGKGNEATLAARIARAWAKSGFEPLPLLDDGDGGKGDEEHANGEKLASKSKRSANDADDSSKICSKKKKSSNGDEKPWAKLKKQKVSAKFKGGK